MSAIVPLFTAMVLQLIVNNRHVCVCVCCFSICSTPCCLARCLFSVRGRAWPTRALKKSWRKSNRVTFHLKERPGEMCRSRPKTSSRVRGGTPPSFLNQICFGSRHIFIMLHTGLYGDLKWLSLYPDRPVQSSNGNNLLLFLQSCWRWTQTRGSRCVACVTTPGCRTTASYHPTPSWPPISSAPPPPPSTLASKLPLMYGIAISACWLGLNIFHQ